MSITTTVLWRMSATDLAEAIRSRHISSQEVIEAHLRRIEAVNPWDRSRTPGASSGGEAVALATGMSPLGLGNDGLGSLRWPAQCCGISVLKPTLGRIPDASTAGPEVAAIGIQLTAVVGPMARRVADLQAAFEVLAGATWRDPWSVPAPLRGPEPAKPVRVALVVDPAGQGTAKQVQEGVRKAAGYPDPVTTRQSFITRQSLLRAWGEFQEQHPLIVAPIYTDIPFAAGTDLDDGRVAETIRGMRMAMAINALGLPAVALPVGIEDGLPQSVQVIGPRYREDLCLDAAAALEDRVGIITPIDPR